MGLRIDLILLSDPVSKHCVSSTIDESPRGWEKPSDHTPVLVEIDIG
jgi:exodeoxyribonuclease-3